MSAETVSSEHYLTAMLLFAKSAMAAARDEAGAGETIDGMMAGLLSPDEQDQIVKVLRTEGVLSSLSVAYRERAEQILAVTSLLESALDDASVVADRQLQSASVVDVRDIAPWLFFAALLLRVRIKLPGGGAIEFPNQELIRKVLGKVEFTRLFALLSRRADRGPFDLDADQGGSEAVTFD